ncbi:MAG TPA: hypothetical protein VHM20_06555, partial [Gammaproteobacteria bacterium]|nr:hypothetical protein [Gammaproteobacteria bacterium]
MKNGNNNLNHYTLRQFILNDEPPLDPAQTAEAIKRGFFASVFYHTINAFKSIALKSIVLVMTFLSLIEISHDYFYSVREKNRNANFWFRHILSGVLVAAELIAVTFFVVGTLVSAIIAPAIFTAITGLKLLLSMTKAAYYGAKVFGALMENNNDTQQYLYHKRLFQEHLKNTVIAAGLFAGVFVGFLAPEVVPAIAIPATLALGLKWAACSILGSVGILTLGKKINDWRKSKSHPTPNHDPAEEPILSREEYLLSHKLKLTDAAKDKYLQNAKLDHLIPSHIDDLLIKMEVTNEKNHTDRNYLAKLITQERLRVSINSDKWNALKMLEKLMNGENLHLRFQHVTYDNTVFGFAQYLHDTGALRSILRSSFEDVGGMQKIFVLVDHYCKLHPEVLYKNSAELDEKENSQDSTEYLRELLQGLRLEN